MFKVNLPKKTDAVVMQLKSLTPDEQIQVMKKTLCKNVNATDAQLMTALTKLKQKVALKQAPTYKTKDGAEVQITKLEVGGIVIIADVPAPKGEIILADKTKVKVGVNGVIAAVESYQSSGQQIKPKHSPVKMQAAKPAPAKKPVFVPGTKKKPVETITTFLRDDKQRKASKLSAFISSLKNLKK